MHSPKPTFGLSVMYIINTIEVEVFSVPGERALPHAEIKERSIDTFNTDLLIVDGIIQD